MKTEKSGIVLKKTSAEIAKFKAINGPGVYEVHAGSSNWVEQEGLPEGKFIVGLKAIAKEKTAAFVALFDETDEIAIEDLSGLTMTANMPVNNGRANTPMKNQLVKINVDYVKNRDGKDVLAVTAIEVPKAMKGASLFSAEETEEDSTRISTTNADHVKSFEDKKVTV